MYLYINGGLGNQLFQLTYANFVSESRRSEIFLVPQNIAFTDRDFLLGVFLENYPNLKKPVKQHLFVMSHQRLKVNGQK